MEQNFEAAGGQASEEEDESAPLTQPRGRTLGELGAQDSSIARLN
jgi:hypothetical protein